MAKKPIAEEEEDDEEEEEGRVKMEGEAGSGGTVAPRAFPE